MLELKQEMLGLELLEFHYFDDLLADMKLTPVRCRTACSQCLYPLGPPPPAQPKNPLDGLHNNYVQANGVAVLNSIAGVVASE